MSASGSAANYASGHWGKGQFDIKQLAEKYGLDRSNPGRTEHDIYGKDAAGNEIYIGRSNMGMGSNRDLIAAHAAQRHPDEVDHSGLGESLDTSGDIRGAILNQWDGSAAAQAQEEPTIDPRTIDPNNLNQDQKNYKDTRLTNPENNMPRMEINESPDYFTTPETSTSLDPYSDPIKHGNDLNDHYQNKFIPSLKAEAQLTGREIGESTRFNIKEFVGKIPELGDAREAFGFYRDEFDAYS